MTSETPLVDAHVHVFTRDMPVIEGARHHLNYDFTYGELIRTLDEHNVRFAVIAAGSPWGDYYDYTLAALRTHPRRLRGTIICKPTIERMVLEALAREGVVGVRLAFFGVQELPDLTSFEYRSFFRRLADLDWHVHVHAEAEKLAQVLTAVEASGVKLVVDHLGRPGRDGMGSAGIKEMLRLIEKGRTWVKLSGGYRIGAGATAFSRDLIRRAGPERIMWASDCPFAGYEGQFTYQSTIDWARECVSEPGSLAKVLGQTALEFYFQHSRDSSSSPNAYG